MTNPSVSHPRRPGRPFNITTPLGQAMLERGLQVKDVGRGTGINQRTLSDYLASRKPMLPRHCALLSEYLQVPPAVLLGREPRQTSRGEMERERGRSNAAAWADAISEWLSRTDL